MRSIEVVRSVNMEPTELQRVHNLERFISDLIKILGEDH